MTTLRCRTCGREFSEGEQFCSQDGTLLLGDSLSAFERSSAGRGPGASGDPLVGSVLGGRYRILRVIGEGGMGVVYEALHVLIEKHVAIKVLRDTFTGRVDVVERFRQEAKSASKIGHPNIVDVSDFGEIPSGQSYIVMEMLTGEDLADVLARERVLHPTRAVRIAYQIARALHATHKKGIVHRDLKPENIYLVERDGVKDVVKIVDFGVAKMNDVEVRPGRRLTRTGMLFGTPEYMSPEQSQGKPFDHRVDVYALGAILFELLAGRVPFIGENFMEILSHHGHSPLPTLSSVNSSVQVSPELESVVRRALAKEPADRYDTMGAFADDLRSVPEMKTAADLGQLSSQSEPPSAPTRLITPPPLPASDRSRLSSLPRHTGQSALESLESEEADTLGEADSDDAGSSFDQFEQPALEGAQDAVLVAPGRSLNAAAKVGLGIAVLASGVLAAGILQRSPLSLTKLPRLTHTTTLDAAEEARPAPHSVLPGPPQAALGSHEGPRTAAEPGGSPTSGKPDQEQRRSVGAAKAGPGAAHAEGATAPLANNDFAAVSSAQGAVMTRAAAQVDTVVEVQVRTIPRGASVSALGTDARCEPTPCALLVPRDRAVTLRAEARNTSVQRTYTFTDESEIELRLTGARARGPSGNPGNAVAKDVPVPPHAPSDLKVPSIFRDR